MVTFLFLFPIFFLLLILSTINITSSESKFSSRLAYFLIVGINAFIPKINNDNKMLINGIFSIISSITISFIYTFFTKDLLDQKIFFSILIMIPSIFSTISMNFIDIAISSKRRIMLYITESEINIVDEITKKENSEAIKNNIASDQRKNALNI